MAYNGRKCVHCGKDDAGVYCCYYDDPDADIAPIGFECSEEACPLLNAPTEPKE